LAARSVVLLKNNGVLPLDRTKPLRVALFGKSARAPVVGGGGSGAVVPAFVPSPYDAIRARLGG